MRVHHLNCGTMCPLGGHFMDGVSPGIGPSKLVCHCLLIETEEGLVLVDTGFGTEDMRNPHHRLSEFFIRFNRIRLNEDETALRQIERMGFKSEDVRHIVITHLDFDHAGGLSDFPNATVHLLRAEYESAMHPKSLLDIARYRAQQWKKPSQWQTYEAGGERWFDFDCVRNLKGLPPEILMVPLIGHTWGHTGVAVQTGNGWLLHAGDAYFYRREVDPDHPRSTIGLRAYQTMMEVDRRSRLWNQGRLRELVNHHFDEVTVFSSHDRLELEWAQKNDYRWAPRALAKPRSLTHLDYPGLEGFEHSPADGREPLAGPPLVSP